MKRLLYWVLLTIAAFLIYTTSEHVPAVHRFFHSPGLVFFAVLFFGGLRIATWLLNWRKRRRELQARHYAVLVQQQAQPAYRVTQHYEERTVTIRRGERGIYD